MSGKKIVDPSSIGVCTVEIICFLIVISSIAYIYIFKVLKDFQGHNNVFGSPNYLSQLCCILPCPMKRPYWILFFPPHLYIFFHVTDHFCGTLLIGLFTVTAGQLLSTRTTSSATASTTLAASGLSFSKGCYNEGSSRQRTQQQQEE